MWNEIYLYNLVSQYLPYNAEILTDLSTGKPSVYLQDIDKDHVLEIVADYKFEGMKHTLLLKNFFGFWYPIDTSKNQVDRCDGSSYSDHVCTVDLYPAPVETVGGTKWGYINNNGDFVIKPQFDNARSFQHNGLAVVQRNSLSGLINSSGKTIMPPKYDDIMDFSEGRASVVDKSGFRVIDENGNVITHTAYSYIGIYSDGRALVSNTNSQGELLYGYLDRQGTEVIPIKYLSGNQFSNRMALVKTAENKYALIGLKGEELYTYNYGMVGELGDGLLAFRNDISSKYGYINIEGNIVLPPSYTVALPFNNSRAIVSISEDYNNQYGIIDKRGNFLIKPIYNDIMDLGDTLVALGKAIDPEKPYLGSKYALANSLTGNVLSDFIYTSIAMFDKGFASVSTGEKTFFIDKIGKQVTSLPIIDGNGTLSFEGCLIKATVDYRFFYLDKNGDIVWEPSGVIELNEKFKIIEKKYKPNKDYLVYYPLIEGIRNSLVQTRINNELKNLSLVKPIGEEPLDYSYTGDFDVIFFKEDLLVLKLYGYEYYFGAAHGMPTEVYPHIDLRRGRFYKLKDLFLPGSNYVQVISEIIEEQITNNPEYSYVFPDSFEKIKKDQGFYVDEDALYIYFTPYEIAPYAAGFPTFRIPFTKLKNIINVKGNFWKSFH